VSRPLVVIDADVLGRQRTGDESYVENLLRELPPIAGDLEPGAYRLVFHPPSPYFRRVELELELDDGHHHVPLLVSSYSCATYRGS